MMISFLKNDVVQYFGFGFGIGAVALFMAQPQEARADIIDDLALDSAAETVVSAAAYGARTIKG